MDNKYKDEVKDESLNPVDWFNFFADFQDIFKNDKNYHYNTPTEVVHMDNLKEVLFKLNKNDLVDVIGKNDFDIASGSKCSKFMLFNKARFKGDYFASISFIRFYMMGQKIPFIRVGGDYYKLIEKQTRYGGVEKILKHWKKEEIKQDHTAAILKQVYKYDDFDIIPDNKCFIPVRNGCYNLYSPFCHDTHQSDIVLEDIPFSFGIMQHIFGEQIQLGFKYMKLLYEEPTQILPILALVSTERGTGKTTFLNWVHMIFGENTVLISPDDLMRGFNSIYATKNIIMVDETVVEKSTTVEKLKSIATAKSISVSQKHVSEYSIPFFGKVILCTNKEKDFMRIDEEEVRFWIRKIRPVTTLNTNIEEDLFKEIPKFIKYLTQLPAIDKSKSRMVFTMDEIATSQLKDVKEESRSQLFKDMEILFEDMFVNKNLKSFKATAVDIKDMFFAKEGRYGLSYIRKVIKEEMKLKNEKMQRYHPFGQDELQSKTGEPFLFVYKTDEIEQTIDNQSDNYIPF